ncbi:MAG TPA: hypothetical protein V6C72_00435, partial [Chroococcales cyanobacterium]
DLTGAKFHSIDWYEMLASIMPADAVLAVNAVSPHATPRAYWSIVNSILASRLSALPYHVQIPSFQRAGFGKDWGFILASPTTVHLQEIESAFPFADTQSLRNMDLLRELFRLPQALFQYQEQGHPFLMASDILLQYFRSDRPLTEEQWSDLRAAGDFCHATLSIPEIDTGTDILPFDLGSALSKTIWQSSYPGTTDPADVQLFLHEVLDLVPTMHREQTNELIAEFLEEPAVFLEGIDLNGVVSRLLSRARDLPAQLVEELNQLAETMTQWAGDNFSLMAMGRRVLSVLILVIVVGNLLYPDMVYAKGAHGGHEAAAARHAGDRGGRDGLRRGGTTIYGGGGGRYWNGTRYIYTTPLKRPPRGPMGPGPSQILEKQMLKNSLPQPDDVSVAPYRDEAGNVYPARSYKFEAASGGALAAVYKLGPGADLLATGKIAMALPPSAALIISEDCSQIVDQNSGVSVMSLQHDRTMLEIMQAELIRQNERLGSEGDTEDEFFAFHHSNLRRRLTAASELLQSALQRVPPLPDLQSANAVEIFPGAWITEDGKYVAVRRTSGDVAFIDGAGWYCAPGGASLTEEYPARFRALADSYLSKMVRDVTATKEMLQADNDELSAHLKILTAELAAYRSEDSDMVTFGSRQMPKSEAIRLTESAIGRIDREMKGLAQHIDGLPAKIDTVRLALQSLSKDGKNLS